MHGHLIKRFLVILGAISAAVLVAYVSMEHQALGTDDAHIFFVYGKNIAAGWGPAYNAGGEWIEGFTSMLWTLIVALAWALFEQPEVWLLLFSVIAVSLAIALLGELVTRGDGTSGRAWILAAWTVCSPSFVVWTSITLMDTALWTTLLVVGVVSALTIEASARHLALVVGAMVVCRPESILWGPILIGAHIVTTSAKHGWREGWVRTRLAVVTYLVTLSGLTLVRLAIFGYPLPNTYYAKVSPDFGYNLSQGMAYLAAFLCTNPPAVLGVVVAVTGVIVNLRWFLSSLSGFPLSKEERTRVRHVISSLLVLVGLVTPTLTGGDHLRLFRFYQPIWPLMILPALDLIDIFGLEICQRAGWILAIIVAIAMVTTPHANWINGKYQVIRKEFEIAERGEALGARLNSMFGEPLPSVGVIAAGGIALEYRGTVVDLMGLNNAAMAHSPGKRHGFKNHTAFNEEVFFAQLPNILLPSNMKGTRPEKGTYSFANKVLNGLLTGDRFQDRYRLVVLSSHSHGDILAWVERDYLGTIGKRGIEVELIATTKSVFQ